MCNNTVKWGTVKWQKFAHPCMNRLKMISRLITVNLTARCLCAGQQSQAQSTGPDYSKAWEEYYKKQGEFFTFSLSELNP